MTRQLEAAFQPGILGVAQPEYGEPRVGADEPGVVEFGGPVEADGRAGRVVAPDGDVLRSVFVEREDDALDGPIGTAQRQLVPVVVETVDLPAAELEPAYGCQRADGLPCRPVLTGVFDDQLGFGRTPGDRVHVR